MILLLHRKSMVRIDAFRCCKAAGRERQKRVDGGLSPIPGPSQAAAGQRRAGVRRKRQTRSGHSYSIWYAGVSVGLLAASTLGMMLTT
jgi:hypothetical protein